MVCIQTMTWARLDQMLPIERAEGSSIAAGNSLDPLGRAAVRRVGDIKLDVLLHKLLRVSIEIDLSSWTNTSRMPYLANGSEQIRGSLEKCRS